MIYEKVVAFCRLKNISVTDFEKENGFGNGAVGKWQKFNPRTDTLKKLANIMGTTVDDLLKDED